MVSQILDSHQLDALREESQALANALSNVEKLIHHAEARGQLDIPISELKDAIRIL